MKMLFGLSPSAETRIVGVLHCVPTTPGHSRLIACFADNFVPPVVPNWLSDQISMKVLDTDHVFLHLLVSGSAQPSAWVVI